MMIEDDVRYGSLCHYPLSKDQAPANTLIERLQKKSPNDTNLLLLDCILLGVLDNTDPMLRADKASIQVYQSLIALHPMWGREIHLFVRKQLAYLLESRQYEAAVKFALHYHKAAKSTRYESEVQLFDLCRLPVAYRHEYNARMKELNDLES